MSHRYVYASKDFGQVLYAPDGSILARFDQPGQVPGTGRYGTDDPVEAARLEAIAKAGDGQHHEIERVSDEDPTEAATAVAKAREANDAAAAEAARLNAAANPGAATAETPVGATSDAPQGGQGASAEVGTAAGQPGADATKPSSPPPPPAAPQGRAPKPVAPEKAAEPPGGDTSTSTPPGDKRAEG